MKEQLIHKDELYVHDVLIRSWLVYECAEECRCQNCKRMIQPGEYKGYSNCTRINLCEDCINVSVNRGMKIGSEGSLVAAHNLQNGLDAWKKYKRNRRLKEIQISYESS